MKLLERLFVIIIFNITIASCCLALDIKTHSFTENSEDINSACEVIDTKTTLVSGWFEWRPYQYEKNTPYGPELTGLDNQLQNYIAKSIGADIQIPYTSWEQHIEGIKNGTKDLAPGATFTKERSEFAYFSEAYRYEENSLFVSKKIAQSLRFKNIGELLAQIKALGYKIGTLSGAVWADEEINNFINDPSNSDIIINNVDDTTNLKDLVSGNIDGFITDRLVGSAIIINNNAGNLVEEVPLNIKVPISFMLSKKTISSAFLEKINKAIIDLKNDGTYKKIVRDYLYPVFLLQTINADWFYYVTLIGVIAFALSGVALAAKDNMTLFGTIFLAILPSFIGGIVKDVVTNEGLSDLDNSSFYIYIVISVVLIGFSFIRILEVFNKDAKKDKLMQVFWEHFFVFTDALGQAAFIVTGVTVVIVAKLSPLEIWGPIFAFLAANGGTMIRDLFTRNKEISALSGDLNAEVSLIWGFIFSLFLQYIADNPSSYIISMTAAAVVIGAFLTRLATIYYKLPNIRFR